MGRARATFQWLAVLPGAIAGGFALNVIITFLTGFPIGVFLHLPMDGWLARLWLEGVGSAAWGAGGVFIGAAIAPSQKTHTVFLLAGVFVLAAGFLLAAAVFAHSWWLAYDVTLMAIGAGGLVWSVYTGKTSASDLVWRRLVELMLFVVVGIAPIFAMGSMWLVIRGDHGWLTGIALAMMGLTGFPFIGMFAASVAQHLRNARISDARKIRDAAER